MGIKYDFESALDKFSAAIDVLITKDGQPAPKWIDRVYKVFLEREIYQAIKYAINLAIKTRWRSIDTAPKDGTEILLCEKNEEDSKGVYIFTGYYSFNTWLCSEYDAFCKNPTHWMPLPDAPEIAP